MARIVFGSYMVRYPLGGMLSWALQYIVGLHRLGHRVVFVERANYPDACYDPAGDSLGDDPTTGVNIVRALLDRFGLPAEWCFVDVHGTHYGLSETQVRQEFAAADLFVDMGTHGAWNDIAALAGKRVLVDGEPGFTQLKRDNALQRGQPVTTYDGYFTSGVNVGTPRSAAPDAGVEWHALPHPVVVDLFEPSEVSNNAPVTTVMNWQSYEPVGHNGRVYGHKDVSFEVFADLPSRVDTPVELAVAGPTVPHARLRSLGWQLRDGHLVTQTVDDFWGYIRDSRAEFSICKEGYVALRTGWFSDRGGAYLASGRPVIQQDTGFGDLLPTGEGLFAVATVDEAADAIAAITSDPVRHCRAAREIAEEYLNSSKVLSAWLEDVLA